MYQKCYQCRYSRWLLAGLVVGPTRRDWCGPAYRIADGEEAERMRCVRHGINVETFETCDGFEKYKMARCPRPGRRGPIVTKPRNSYKRTVHLSEADIAGRQTVTTGGQMTIISPNGRTIRARLVDGKLNLRFHRREHDTVINLSVNMARELARVLPIAYDTKPAHWPERPFEVRCLDGELLMGRADAGEWLFSVYAVISQSGPWNTEVHLSRRNADEFESVVNAYLTVVDKYSYMNGELSQVNEALREFDGLMALSVI